jgi:histidinol-phosphate phosphatase family protein
VNRAVFIDRDGTINRDVPYCSRPEDFELLPGAAEAIRLLNEHGFKVVVVTNQSGIARGYFTEEMLARIHDKMRTELARHGAHVDAIYYCPHHPDDNCDCRKPKPKMVLQAAEDLDIDLSQSYVIGDDQKDMELARRAGCKAGIRVGKPEDEGDVVAASFGEAVDRVLWQTPSNVKPGTDADCGNNNSWRARHDMKVAILAGGLGTRLGSLTKDTPKPMLRIQGKPFLEYQLELLKKNNLRQTVLCVGYLKDKIKSHFGDGSQFGVTIEYSEEDKPLGTAGALKNAESLLGEDFLVLNGDTYLDIDYGEAIERYRSAKKLGLMVVRRIDPRYDKGNVMVARKVVAKYDRSGEAGNMTHIDCGLSVLNREALEIVPHGQFFQLDEVYHGLAQRRELVALVTNVRFYDIGSPAGLEEFTRAIQGAELGANYNKAG